MVDSPYAARTREPEASSNADQIELSAMRGKWAVVDDAAADDVVSGQLDDEAYLDARQSDDGGRHSWQERDISQEQIVGDAASEIHRRSEALGSAYPFRIDGNRIVYTGSRSGFYEFCLATAQAPTIVKKPYVQLPRIFERTTAGLVKLYFGPNAKAIHTGWPRRPKSRFKAISSKIADGRWEWRWRPEDGLDDDPSYTVVKDETVDFVIVANKLDARPGNLYILGQCACGNDWDTKLDEPNPQQISKWFSPAWLIPPVKAFTTPFVLGDELMRETVRRGRMLVFDRIRLTLIAERDVSQLAVRKLKPRLDAISDLVTRGP